MDWTTTAYTRAILEAVMKRKIPSPCQESNPRTPIIQPLVINEKKSTKINVYSEKLCIYKHTVWGKC